MAESRICLPRPEGSRTDPPTAVTVYALGTRKKDASIRCGLLSQKDRVQCGLLPDLARRFAPQQCVRVISLLLVEHPPLIRRALVARLLLESDLCVVRPESQWPQQR
jgi:hypothetical protein